MMHGLIEGSIAMGELFTVFLVSYWTVKALEPKEDVVPVTVEHQRYRKVA
ncbi:MAG: hypothetical protein Nkreftii_000299 [Candidatus Nitrospira kreftii]|uniref:Uncharacterized protein n=1 Tax=Candidatus Nitrospira kreftii TaxID=2652173 RepID=A0A7S8FAV6_9BACT|nr:MAG: hypothetical protein Nkreftii_000299 [Candidatus Nitrospira kreftii]